VFTAKKFDSITTNTNGTTFTLDAAYGTSKTLVVTSVSYTGAVAAYTNTAPLLLGIFGLTFSKNSYTNIT
jgi:hypothetical protein